MLLTSLDLDSENDGGMPFRVSHLQSLCLEATLLDWHLSLVEASTLTASLTSLQIYGSRIPHRMHSLQALLALRYLEMDFDLQTVSLKNCRHLSGLLFDQLCV